MEGGEDVSIEELASNLSTYKDQLHQVRKLLVDEPGNSEYADMEKELEEVIGLTEELLTTAKQNEQSGLVSHQDADISPGQELFTGTLPFNTVLCSTRISRHSGSLRPIHIMVLPYSGERVKLQEGSVALDKEKNAKTHSMTKSISH